MPDFSLEQLPEYDMSVKEAAEVCGIGVQMMRIYIREGRLKAIKIGRSYRIRPADLLAFVTGDVAAGSASVVSEGDESKAPDIAELLYAAEPAGDAAA